MQKKNNSKKKGGKIQRQDNYQIRKKVITIYKIWKIKKKRGNMKKLHSPIHTVPFPLYPLLHVQLNEPALFVQVAFPSQGFNNTHSFTSIRRKT